MPDDELNIDFGEMYSFDMMDGDVNIGQMQISVHKQKKAARGKDQIYPDSWFIGDSEQLKPVLEIDGFGTVGHHASGYGRAGLQRAYEMSIEQGCEGRIEVIATWGAGSFYEHCGFVGKNKGEAGIKYFEPTQENIAKLYKGGKRENLSLQTAKPMFDFDENPLEGLIEPLDVLDDDILTNETKSDLIYSNDLEKKRKEVHAKLEGKKSKTKSTFKRGMLKFVTKFIVPEKLGKTAKKIEQKIANIVYHKKQTKR